MSVFQNISLKFRLLIRGISLHQDENFYFVREKGRDWYFARLQRLHRYEKGLDRILDKVADSYSLHRVKLNSEQVFLIDIGSNVGEFTKCIQMRFPKTTSLLIESEQQELECASRNLAGSGESEKKRHSIIPVNATLWSTFGCSEFFLAPGTADSSLYRSPLARWSLFKTVIPLDSLWRDLGSPSRKVDILKIDAEGAEPEVLMGGKEVLKITQYVLVDAGPERGLLMETTIEAVKKILFDLDFSLVHQGVLRPTYIFRNIRFGEQAE